MTRKEYVLIASVISSLPWSDGDDETLLCKVIDNLAEAFSRDNPRFDSARFKLACLP